MIELELATLHSLRELENDVISGPVSLEKFQHPCLTSSYCYMETLNHLQRLYGTLKPVNSILTVILGQEGDQPLPTVLDSLIDHRCPP